MKQTTKTLVTSLLFLVMILHLPPAMTAGVNDYTSYFSMSLKELMNIEVSLVTASKDSQKIADIPASVVLIKRSDIEQFGYSNLAEILSNIPGLFPTDDYSWGGTNFGVRGFWSGVANRNMIVLINGVTQINDYESNYPLTISDIPVEAIDRIEVIRGPMSVIYGSGAFFGVINIVTNIYKDSAARTNVNLSYGTRSTKRMSVRNQGKEGRFKYVLNASLMKTAGLDQPYVEMTSNPLQELGLRAGQTTKNTLEESNQYFLFSGQMNRLHVNIGYNETTKEQFLQIPAASDGGPLNLNHTYLSLSYQKDYSSNLSFTFKGSYHHTLYAVLYDSYIKNFDMEQTIGSNGYETEINALLKLRKNISLTSGISYRDAYKIFNNIVSTSLGDSSLLHTKISMDKGSHAGLMAGFSQIDYSITPKIKLTAGLRLERLSPYTIREELAAPQPHAPKPVRTVRYAYDDWQAVPRVALIQTFNENHLIKLLYGEALNRPSFQQTIDEFLGFQENLKPERICTLELLYLGSPIHGVTTSLSLFRNEMTDLLVRDHYFTEGSYVSFFSNIGKLITNGLECSLKSNLASHLFVDVSATYQETSDRVDQDRDVAYSPQLLGYIKLSYTYGNFIISTTSRYVDQMKTYYDPAIRSRIGKETPGYWNIGANLRIRNFWDDRLYLNLRMNNLMNTDIFYPTFTNNRWADLGTLGESRTILCTVGMNFR